MEEASNKQSENCSRHDDKEETNSTKSPSSSSVEKIGSNQESSSHAIRVPSSNEPEGKKGDIPRDAWAFAMGPGAFPVSAGDECTDDDAEFDGDDLSVEDLGFLLDIQQKKTPQKLPTKEIAVGIIAPKAPGDDYDAGRLQNKAFGDQAVIDISPAEAPDVENQGMIKAEIAPNIDDVVQDAVRKAVEEALNAKEKELEESQRQTYDNNGVPKEVIVAHKLDERTKTICGLPKLWLFILIVLFTAGIAVAILAGGGAFSSSEMPLDASMEAPTQAPSSKPDSEIDLLMDLLHSGLSIQNITSGQYHAAKWITQSDPRKLDPSVLTPEFLERFALADLYFSTSGDYWTGSNQWLSEAHHCFWDFVACNEQDSVVSFDASSQGLTGTLPAGIKFLTSMTSLTLSRNAFEYSSLPQELFSLTNLVDLDLQRNLMAGTIPTEIGRLSALETLKLGWNLFEGSVPTEFGNLSNLTYLEAQFNKLSGTIHKLAKKNSSDDHSLY